MLGCQASSGRGEMIASSLSAHTTADRLGGRRRCSHSLTTTVFSNGLSAKVSQKCGGSASQIDTTRDALIGSWRCVVAATTPFHHHRCHDLGQLATETTYFATTTERQLSYSRCFLEYTAERHRLHCAAHQHVREGS